MRLSKRLLCVLLVCALAITAGFAAGEDAGTAVPETQAPETPAPVTEAPTQAPADTPPAEETTAPTAEPTAEPTVEPTQEPTMVPGSEPTIEPTMEPSPEPTAEPTQVPDSEPSLEPTAEPTPEATVFPKPTAEPHPLPGDDVGLVKIAPEGEAVQKGDVWRISLTAPDALLSFTWTVDAEAAAYLVYVQTGPEDLRFITETDQARIELSPADYANGQYTLHVGAVLADGNITWGKAVFELESRNPGFPGGFPGGMRPGGFSGAGAMGEAAMGEQGFRVTPGQALTSKHSSGNMDNTAYTFSRIDASDEAVAALVLGSTQAEITLDGGAFFFIAEENGRLQLTPESAGSEWKLNALAMNTLADSDIERVVFQLGGVSYSLPTRMEFSGSTYASLRTKGYVSKDMEICIDAQGVRVQVAGGVYRIGENGELLAYEE